MTSHPAKSVFVQRISYRSKQATLSNHHTEQQLQLIKQISSTNYLSPQCTVNGKLPLSVSWAPTIEQEKKYGMMYKCSKADDMTHSKFLSPSNRQKNRRGSYAIGQNNDKLISLDEFLSKNKMHSSFIIDDSDADHHQEKEMQDLFVEFGLSTKKSQTVPPNPETFIQKSSSFCKDQNLEEFSLSKGFTKDDNKSTSSRSSIMKQEDTRALYRSIVFESQSYDNSKSGFLIESIAGKEILDQIESYLIKNGKNLDDPFFELKLTLVIEDETFDTTFLLKFQDNNISYSWNCKKEYPNVSYFDRKFQFFNHFRIEIFSHSIRINYIYIIEPFLLKRTFKSENFSFQMISTVPLKDLSKTKTTKTSEARLNSFIEEHHGSLTWSEMHP